jgi:aminoglycoside 6-adenylyltransferase
MATIADTHLSDPIIQQLIHWAEHQALVRAMLMTSTRAIPHGSVDALSDYDIILVVTDIQPFFEDRSWLNNFGEVLVAYWDPIYELAPYGIEIVGNVIQFADGLKIDFTLWPVDILRQIIEGPALPDELDAGYAILADKDYLAEALQPSTYTAYIPQQPSNEIYQRIIEEFFSDVPYVAKCLLRNELLPMKWALDYDMKHVYLLQMLEWRVECDHNWSQTVGSLGKGLKKRLPPDIWAQLEASYAGAGIEENWESLFRTIALYRRVAREVADKLGYTYPEALDRRVTAYVQRMRGKEPVSSIDKA